MSLIMYKNQFFLMCFYFIFILLIFTIWNFSSLDIYESELFSLAKHVKLFMRYIYMYIYIFFFPRNTNIMFLIRKNKSLFFFKILVIVFVVKNQISFFSTLKPSKNIYMNRILSFNEF